MMVNRALTVFLAGVGLTVILINVYSKNYVLEGSMLLYAPVPIRAEGGETTTEAGWVSEVNQSQLVHSSYILYNRVPKCASSTTFAMFRELGPKNGFTPTRILHYPENYVYHSQKRENDFLEDSFLKHKNRMLISNHVFFIDFEKRTSVFQNTSQQRRPIYINLIREPVERMQSFYYFIRFQKGHLRKMAEERRNMSFTECVRREDPECTGGGTSVITPQMAYFCGDMAFCRLRGQGAVERAKQNVVRHYAMVGVTEQLRDFFFALEAVLPNWFRGAQNVYDEAQNQNRNQLTSDIPYSRKLDADTIRLLQAMFQEEYDFYFFVRQRFNSFLQLKRGQENT